MISLDDSTVELRCAVAIVHGEAVLPLQRWDRSDWMLRGGRPRRDTREGTGLDVRSIGSTVATKIKVPPIQRRMVELVSVVGEFDGALGSLWRPGERYT